MNAPVDIYPFMLGGHLLAVEETDGERVLTGPDELLPLYAALNAAYLALGDDLVKNVRRRRSIAGLVFHREEPEDIPKGNALAFFQNRRVKISERDVEVAAQVLVSSATDLKRGWVTWRQGFQGSHMVTVRRIACGSKVAEIRTDLRWGWLRVHDPALKTVLMDLLTLNASNLEIPFAEHSPFSEDALALLVAETLEAHGLAGERTRIPRPGIDDR